MYLLQDFLEAWFDIAMQKFNSSKTFLLRHGSCCMILFSCCIDCDTSSSERVMMSSDSKKMTNVEYFINKKVSEKWNFWIWSLLYIVNYEQFITVLVSLTDEGGLRLGPFTLSAVGWTNFWLSTESSSNSCLVVIIGNLGSLFSIITFSTILLAPISGGPLGLGGGVDFPKDNFLGDDLIGDEEAEERDVLTELLSNCLFWIELPFFA